MKRFFHSTFFYGFIVILLVTFSQAQDSLRSGDIISAQKLMGLDFDAADRDQLIQKQEGC